MKIPNLTDNPVTAGTDKFGRPNMIDKYNQKLPEGAPGAEKTCEKWPRNTMPS